MPTYRSTRPDGSSELLEADSCRVEGIHTVLRGTAYVIGRPRDFVVRRMPRWVRASSLTPTPLCDAPGHLGRLNR